MKWLLITISLAIINVIIMTLFAASKLEPTPVMLPILLILFSLSCAFVSFRKTLKDKTKQNIISMILWIILIVYNLWQLQLLLYVA